MRLHSFLLSPERMPLLPVGHCPMHKFSRLCKTGFVCSHRTCGLVCGLQCDLEEWRSVGSEEGERHPRTVDWRSRPRDVRAVASCPLFTCGGQWDAAGGCCLPKRGFAGTAGRREREGSEDGLRGAIYLSQESVYGMLCDRGEKRRPVCRIGRLATPGSLRVKCPFEFLSPNPPESLKNCQNSAGARNFISMSMCT